MANPNDRQMLRDANGDLIPQYWDITAQDFKPLTGENGAQDTRVTGSIVELFNEEVTVSAGAFTGVTPNMKNEGLREAWCTCVADEEHDFEIRLQMRENHHNMYQFTNDNDMSNVVIGDNLQSVLPKLFITSHIRVAIRNNDLDDRTYQINLRAE